MPARRLVTLLALASALVAGCNPSARQQSAPPGPQAAPAQDEQPAAAYPVTLTDARGVEVTLETPPRRIVSMSPPTTETLFALGLGDRVVGVTRFCTYPEAATDKEKVGGIVDPSLEKIISLSPDVVFATLGNPLPVLESLEAGGVKVFSVNPETYAEVCDSVEALGHLCGVPDKGTQVADGMREIAAQVQETTAHLAQEDRPRALMVIWLDPLHVAGPGTFMDDLLVLAGARNAVGQTEGNPWKQYSVEMAVAADPDVLALTTDHAPGTEDVEGKLEELRRHPAWRGASAVVEERVVVLQGELIMQTTPRLALGLQLLARGIHPDLFPEEPEAFPTSSH